MSYGGGGRVTVAWLSHYSKRRKVVSLIPADVIGIFH
jgi:hypothetical protein